MLIFEYLKLFGFVSNPPRAKYFIRGNDFDGMAYEFCIEEGCKAFVAYFYFECFDVVSKIVGKEFFEKFYPKFKVEFGVSGNDISRPFTYSFKLVLDISAAGSPKDK